MVTLVSRESHQIKFPGGAVERRPPLAPISSTTVTVETGVVVFTLPGTNPHDWTRDTLAFPVGNPGRILSAGSPRLPRRHFGRR
jgi:hypothetical protein